MKTSEGSTIGFAVNEGCTEFVRGKSILLQQLHLWFEADCEGIVVHLIKEWRGGGCIHPK